MATARLRFEPQEGQLYWDNKALYGNQEPQRSALRKLPKTWEESCLYLVPGPALGYGLAEAEEKLPMTSRLLLLEWDLELAEFSKDYLTANGLLPRERMAFVSLLADDCELPRQQRPCEMESTSLQRQLDYAISQIHQFLQENQLPAWHTWCFRRIRVLILNRAFALQKEAFQPLLDWLEMYVQNFWQNRLTLDKLGHLWLRNFFRNLAQLPYAQPTQVCAANVVLVAAGPSLQWHYSWLLHERPNFTLICVDTALLPLLQAGIIPDYVMNLDAQLLNLQDFYGAQALLSGMAVERAQSCPDLVDSNLGLGLTQIADLSCDPRSFTAIRVPFILTATQFAPMRLWQRFSQFQKKLTAQRSLGLPLVAELEPLGSVGVSSLAVALQNQPRCLILVGYDFAYPKDLHHVRGTSIHQKLLQNSCRLRPPNSFGAALQRPLLDATALGTVWELADGFVTDKVLRGYALQLQNYLHRHRGAELETVARLDGPLELPGIRTLQHSEASALLRLSQLASEKKLRPTSAQSPLIDETKQTLAAVTAVREFWQHELKILEELQSFIRSGISEGKLNTALEWWQHSNFAADYLLRLCLPKAGYREIERCNWPKLLQLSQDFSTLLRALLEEP